MATATTVAASFGYSVTFFNSSPELKKLLSTAVSQNWTTDQFVAKFRATKWYRAHGEAFREMTVLRTTDPATYKARIATQVAAVNTVAGQMGARLSSAGISNIAVAALLNGWSEAQIRSSLQRYVLAGASGNFAGGAATVQMQLRQMLDDYGYNPSTKQMGLWVSNIIKGTATLEGVQESVISLTASKFPGLKDRLMGGETLADIAAPYIDSYARILEVNPKTLSLNDGTLMKALQAKDAKGAPTTRTIWQFEQDLRNDPRWRKTKNAQDSMMGTTHDVLKNLGFSAI